MSRSPYGERRERVLEGLEGSVLLLPAAPQLFRSRDTEVPYRPDSDLFYLSGVTEPEAVLVLAPSADDGPYWLFVRDRDAEAERWTGPRPGPECAREVYGADAAFPLSELESRVTPLLQEALRVHCRLGADPRTDALVHAALGHARRRGPRKGTGVRAVVDPSALIDELRLIKDAHELQRMRRAAAISVEAFRAAYARIAPGVGEWEIEATLDGAFRAGGGDRPAFETIVGSGANGCVLHYVDNRDRIEEGDLVLMDAGAAFELYAADITRTVPATGRFTDVQRSVHEWVDRARAEAIACCVPGRTTADAHDAAVRVLTEGLLELGALEGDLDDLIEAEAHRAWFPHQTSHWLGLDVHDVGDYARDGVPRVLEPGMVLTIEPGLYFAPDAPDVPESLAGIGVRLEDDVHVTEGEPEVFTAELPVSADAIEECMA